MHPGSILAITTNKAAAEMRERVACRAGGQPGVKLMWVSTFFHSACVRILRSDYRSVRSTSRSPSTTTPTPNA
ncbi:MAG: UvrD-helicase domain-containing protein [Tessaracoccus sp.]